MFYYNYISNNVHGKSAAGVAFITKPFSLVGKNFCISYSEIFL